jgi:hypothetical protein
VSSVTTLATWSVKRSRCTRSVRQHIVKIDSGILVAKNSEYGTYRCPFSPSRMKKQISFRHQDPVADATRGIGRHGKNGSLLKLGNHRALEKLYLMTAAEMHQQRDKQAPDERRRLQEQVVPGRVAKEKKSLMLLDGHHLQYWQPRTDNRSI